MTTEEIRKKIEEEEQAIISGNADRIERVRKHLHDIMESESGKRVIWGEIDRMWVMYDYIGLFFEDMKAKDARTIVNHIIKGEHE